MRKSLASIRRTVQVGKRYSVTNYWLRGSANSCYGTTQRVVVNANEASIYMRRENGAVSRIIWPKADQVQMDDSGVISLYGSGADQDPKDLFMTLTPVE